MSPAEFLKHYTEVFPSQPAPASADAGALIALLGEDSYAARAENDAQGWLSQIYFHPERAWSEAVQDLMVFYQAEIDSREAMIARQDRDWRYEVERISRDYQAEIVRIGRERERMLAEQDAAWRGELKRVAQDYRAEILRLCRERDKLLADQELVWQAGSWKRFFYPGCRRGALDQALAPLEAEPLVSIIIVNFNGLHFLKTLLPSLLQQTYRRFEIILVDNASSDASIEFVSHHYPAVRIIRAPRNLGFAGGNNLGFQAAQGSVLALINNDAVVEPDWLFHLVDEMRFDPRIAAVGSKITFYKPYIALTLRSPTFCPAAQGHSTDTRSLGLLVSEESAIVQCGYHKTAFGQGFYGAETIAGRIARWTSGEAELLLPCETDRDLTVRIIAAGGPGNAGQRFTVEFNHQPIGEAILTEGFTEYEFALPAAWLSGQTFYVINNAGSVVDDYGNAGDRGIYQPDQGQYDAAQDVTALCGCSLLLRREALKQVGGFDSDFFMYFEDTDLSWRLRRQGYRLRYQPESVVRHIHAGSSREWSPLFMFYTARNRVLMVIKNASWKAVVVSYGREWYYALALSMALLRSLRRGGPAAHLIQEFKLRLFVQTSLMKQLPKMLMKRWGFAAQSVRGE